MPQVLYFALELNIYTSVLYFHIAECRMQDFAKDNDIFSGILKTVDRFYENTEIFNLLTSGDLHSDLFCVKPAKKCRVHQSKHFEW
jgi:hypothetical protein